MQMDREQKVELLRKAITTSIEDRYSIVWDAYMEEPEIFRDDCLRPILVAGLGGSWSELANLLVRVLKLDDVSVVPLLKEGFDPKGKKEMVRRMEVLETVAGALENEFYLSVLPEAEKKVREAVIYALRHAQENTELLIQLAEKEKGACKQKAIQALARVKGTGNKAFFEKQLKKNWEKTMEYFNDTENEAISDIVAEELEKQLDIIEECILQGKYTLEDEQAKKLQTILYAIENKSSDRLLDVCRRFVLISTELKRTGRKLISNVEVSFAPEMIAKRLKNSIFEVKSEKLMAFSYEMYDKYPESFGGPAVITALLTENAKHAYERFANIIEAPEGSNVGNSSPEDVFSACQEIAEAFDKVYWDTVSEKYLAGYSKLALFEVPDIRWFQAFTYGKLRISNRKLYVPYLSREGGWDFCDWEGVLHNLVPSPEKCPEIFTLLKAYFEEKAQKATLKELDRIGPRLKSCGVESAKGLLVETLKRNSDNRVLDLWWALEEVPMTVEEKLEELKQIKVLQETGVIEINGWKEDDYQKLCNKVLEKEEDES